MSSGRHLRLNPFQHAMAYVDRDDGSREKDFAIIVLDVSQSLPVVETEPVAKSCISRVIHFVVLENEGIAGHVGVFQTTTHCGLQWISILVMEIETDTYMIVEMLCAVFAGIA